MIEYFDHTADIGIRGERKDIRCLFIDCAKRMLEIIYDRARVSPDIERMIDLSAADVEMLMHDYLSELAHIAQDERFLIDQIIIKHCDETHIKAKLFGEPFDPERHVMLTELKAVTFHDYTVKQHENTIWQVNILFDV